MPAHAEAVFDIVSDLENMTTWLPCSVEIELSSPNLMSRPKVGALTACTKAGGEPAVATTDLGWI